MNNQYNKSSDIIVVDDDPLACYNMKRLFGKHNLSAVFLDNIVDMIIEVHDRSLDPEPFVLICDIRLPISEMDRGEEGYRATAALRWEQEHMDLRPFHMVLLSGYLTAQIEDIAKLQGIRYIWQKPFSESYISLIKDLLNEIPTIHNPTEENKEISSTVLTQINTLRDHFLYASWSSVDRLYKQQLQIRAKDIHFTKENLMAILTVISDRPVFHVGDSNKDRAKEIIRQFGGIYHMRTLFKSASTNLNPFQRKILYMVLVERLPKVTIQEELNLSRRGIDDAFTELIQQLVDIFNTI
jgi:CheY-like chemotaxis protein